MSNITKLSQSTPISKETIKAYLCPNATESELVLAVNICHSLGMNPFAGDVNFIKYDKTKPMQIVTRKDWFFKTANSQEDYEGMDHGIIVMRDGEIVYQNGAFLAPGDQLLGGWAEVYRRGRRPHRAEVSLSEYDKGQSNWKTMRATMINKVAKVHSLRESYPEKMQGVVDESELAVIHATQELSEKPAIEMPTKKQEQKKEVSQDDEKQEASSIDGEAELTCPECNGPIKQEEKDYSIRFFKKAMCRSCQDKHKNGMGR